MQLSNEMAWRHVPTPKRKERFALAGIGEGRCPVCSSVRPSGWEVRLRTAKNGMQDPMVFIIDHTCSWRQCPYHSELILHGNHGKNANTNDRVLWGLRLMASLHFQSILFDREDTHVGGPNCS